VVILLLKFSICEVDPSQTCEQRIPLNTPYNKCEECAYDPVTNTCTSDCGAFYIRNPTTGACENASCSQVTPNMYVIIFL
jgi:hypothetical protein